MLKFYLFCGAVRPSFVRHIKKGTAVRPKQCNVNTEGKLRPISSRTHY